MKYRFRVKHTKPNGEVYVNYYDYPKLEHGFRYLRHVFRDEEIDITYREVDDDDPLYYSK